MKKGKFIAEKEKNAVAAGRLLKESKSEGETRIIVQTVRNNQRIYESVANSRIRTFVKDSVLVDGLCLFFFTVLIPIGRGRNWMRLLNVTKKSTKAD